MFDLWINSCFFLQVHLLKKRKLIHNFDLQIDYKVPLSLSTLLDQANQRYFDC